MLVLLILALSSITYSTYALVAELSCSTISHHDHRLSISMVAKLMVW
jgi:hypothetical protein